MIGLNIINNKIKEQHLNGCLSKFITGTLFWPMSEINVDHCKPGIAKRMTTDKLNQEQQD